MSWVWFAILNALALSAVGITQKKALRDEHALEFVTVTTIIRLILFYAIFWHAIQWTISNGELAALLATAIAAGTGYWFISKALRRQDLSVVFPIINLDAGLTALLALLILHESISAKQLVGLITLLLGTYILHVSEVPSTEQNMWRHILLPFRELWRRPGGRFALLGMTAYAVSAVIDRAVLQTVSWQTYLAYVLPIMMVYFVFLSAARGHTFAMYKHKWKNILPWVLAASVFYLISNIANSIAVSIAAVGLVIAIKRSSSLIDVLVSGKIFHERAVIHKAIAASVMLLGILLILT